MLIHLLSEEEPYGSPTSCSDGEIDDDEEEDEEDDHEDCSSCSEVSEQDAASDEEGNLGEDRTASVLKKVRPPLPGFKWPLSEEQVNADGLRQVPLQRRRLLRHGHPRLGLAHQQLRCTDFLQRLLPTKLSRCPAKPPRILRESVQFPETLGTAREGWSSSPNQTQIPFRIMWSTG